MMNKFASVLVICVSVTPWSTSAQSPNRNVEFLSNLPLAAIGGGRGNDIWGWTDPTTGAEYALMGRTNGTSFVDVTDPYHPVYLGNLPTHTSSSTWRDIKVYQDHAYIVSDNNGPHGVQIFDLTRLRNQTSPRTWTEDANHGGVRSAHNITINEETGFAYVTDGDILDLSNPTNPHKVGTVAPNAHDGQAVVYRGPDQNYVGDEIYFAAYGQSLSIYDVSDKSSPQLLSQSRYDLAQFIHQGWLSEDQHYFFLNDEADGVWTHVYDVSDLSAPEYKGWIQRQARAIDHNLYVKGDFIYSANYEAGLRVFEITDPANVVLTPVAQYDTFPEEDRMEYDGAWSVYPFFDSGTLIVSDISNGLFVLRLDLVPGDFDYDNVFGCGDADRLSRAIAAGVTDSKFDLDGNGTVDAEDLTEWLAMAGAANLASGQSYLMGDANLDGVVDIPDFNAWNGHRFTPDTAWCTGDFNADGVSDSSDFNIWNGNKFQSANATLVPEPSCLVLYWLGGCFLVAATARQGSRHSVGRRL